VRFGDGGGSRQPSKIAAVLRGSIHVGGYTMPWSAA